MKGDIKVIQYLNKILGNELVAINQYFLHSRMYKNWGLQALADHEHKESIDEMKHADKLTERILFLEGIPDLSKRDPLHVGGSVPEMLKNDLALELSVVGALRQAIALCEQQQDYQTREILRAMLEDTEHDHAHWLEKQLGLLDTLGLQNYLQSQL